MKQTPASRTTLRSVVPGMLASVWVTTGCVLPTFLLGGLAVQIRDSLDMPVSGIGTAIATFFGMSAISSIPAGRLIAKKGSQRGFQAAGILGSISLIGIASASSFLTLIPFMGIGGVANAIGHVSSNMYIAARVPRDRQGLAFGMKQAAIPAASLLSGLAVPLIAIPVGWRWAFRLAAMAAISQIFLRPPHSTSQQTSPSVGLIKSRMSARNLAVLALAGGLGGMSGNTLGGFFVDSSVEMGIGEANAGLLFAAGSAIGLTSRLATGWITDRRGGNLSDISILLLMGSLGYLLLASRSPLLILPALLLCFGGGWGWIGRFNHVVIDQNSETAASSTGITNAAVFSGGIVGPLLFGFIAERASYAGAWTITALSASLAAVGMLLTNRMIIREKHPGGKVGAQSDVPPI